MASLADLIFLKPRPQRPLPPSLASQRDLIMLGPNTPASLVPPELPEGEDDDPVLAAQQRARNRAYQASQLLAQQNAVDPMFEASRYPPDPGAKQQYNAIQGAAGQMGWTNPFTGVNDSQGVANPTPAISGPPAAEQAASKREAALDAYTQQKLGLGDSTYGGIKGLAQTFGSMLNPRDPETGMPNVALGAGGPILKGLKAAAEVSPEAVEKLVQEAPNLLDQVLAETASVDRIIPERNRVIIPSRRIVSPRGVNAEEILAQARNQLENPGKGESFADFRELDPDAGKRLFDLDNLEPAMAGRPMLRRYQGKRGPLALGTPTSERVAGVVGDREVEDQLIEDFLQGQQAMPQSWYRTGPLYEHFKSAFGEANAPKEYEDFMRMIAATSPRSSVPNNVRTGSYYNYLRKQGLPMPTPEDMKGSGYGSIAQRLHQQNVDRAISGKWNPLVNPKPLSFTENLLGNEWPVTIDTHNMRAIGQAAEDPGWLETLITEEGRNARGKKIKIKTRPRDLVNKGKMSMDEALNNATFWDSAPAKNEYDPLERWQQGLAERMGVTPATWQEKLWVGAGAKTGLDSPPEPFLATLAARVEYTAAKMGAKPEEILKKFIRGKIPLLSATGAAVGLSDMLSPTSGEPAADRQ